MNMHAYAVADPRGEARGHAPNHQRFFSKVRSTINIQGTKLTGNVNISKLSLHAINGPYPRPTM